MPTTPPQHSLSRLPITTTTTTAYLHPLQAQKASPEWKTAQAVVEAKKHQLEALNVRNAPVWACCAR